MNIHFKIHPATGQRYMAVDQRGKEILLNPLTNKGSAFTNQERDDLKLRGLLPPQICTMKQQIERRYENFLAKPNDLEKYIFLNALYDRNEVLFYRLALEHIEEMMPIIYTPVVGEACQEFSHIYRRARGLYINIHQKDQIEELLLNYGIASPSIIVVTDGERILGLGDQGIGGMAIPIGKLCLYSLCAGLSPYSTIPIILDVGTNNEDRLNDNLYLGLRQKRVTGEAYQAFIDQFISAVKKVYPYVVLQWEDFLKENAIIQLRRFRDALCTFNDDIQGTGAVAVAGIFSALKITKRALRDQCILFVGAGASTHGIAGMLVTALQEDGLSRNEAVKKIWTMDSKGLITKDRNNLEIFKAIYARDAGEVASFRCRDRSGMSLVEVIENCKPTILIGTSGTPGLFDKDVTQAMTKLNQHPIIFALSNPESKSECIPGDVVSWSKGRAIIATGSPFEPVKFNGRHYRFGQGNNAFIFPGFGLGLATYRVRRVTNSMFLESAKALSQMVTTDDLKKFAVYPEVSRIRECSFKVAMATITSALKEGYVKEEDLPENLEENMHQAIWYPSYLPVCYEP